ncbi:MAG TPA: hypothetical protein VFZ74_16950 [Burkholderiales bacterium]
MADSFEYAVDYLPRSTFEGEHFLRRLEKLDLSIVLVVLGVDSEGTNT